MIIQNNLEEFINFVKDNIKDDTSVNDVKYIINYGQPWEKISKKIKKENLPIVYIGQKEKEVKRVSLNKMYIKASLLISFVQLIENPRPTRQQIKNKYSHIIQRITEKLRDKVIFTSEVKVEEKLEKDPIIAVSYLFNFDIYFKV